MRAKWLITAAVALIAVTALPTAATAQSALGPRATPMQGCTPATGGGRDATLPEQGRQLCIERNQTPGSSGRPAADRRKVTDDLVNRAAAAGGVAANGGPPVIARGRPTGPDKAAAPSVLADCGGGWVVHRFEACSDNYLHITTWIQGEPVGQIVFHVVTHVYPEAGSASWHLTSTYDKVPGQWGLIGNTTLTGFYGCLEICTPSGNYPLVRADLVSRFTADGSYSLPLVEGAVAYATPTLTEIAAGPGDPAPPLVTTGPRLRCDATFAPQGCVLPDSPSPSLIFDSGFYDELAVHITLSQDAGAPGANIALHRSTAFGGEQANRDIACPSVRSIPPKPRPPGFSCDEYPFASTREGAASAPRAGRTFDGCQVDWLPVLRAGERAPWSACLVPKVFNDYQGADIAAFYSGNRILNGDAFFVEVI
jgi:hypothetical protein